MQPHISNHNPSTWMHIDLNSCFASIEQQANPFLRGKPIAVAAYATDKGCILAPSREAKRYGIKTGMRVRDGKELYPDLIVMTPDPSKYKFINQKLTQLLTHYSPHVSVRSIDEMLLNFAELPILKTKTIKEVGLEIKQRILSEIGEWLTVSVGISTNPYLAKLAAGLHKPDGLDEITQANIVSILSKLKLTDLPYIKERNQIRLLRVGILRAVDFYHASPSRLKSAFASIVGDYWYMRLHGFSVDEVEWGRRTIGHSYALPKFTSDTIEIRKLLCKLVEKMGRRIRKNNFTARGLHLSLYFADGDAFNKGHLFPYPMYSSKDLFESSCYLLSLVKPLKPVRILAISSFELEENLYNQLHMFSDEAEKKSMNQALDTINTRWGDFTITPGLMMDMQDKVIERIAFGKVHDMKELELQTTTM